VISVDSKLPTHIPEPGVSRLTAGASGMMRAARFHEGEHRLSISEVSIPQPADDEVLVRVAGAGVCHSDVHVLDGLFAEFMLSSVTAGHEIAGEVAAVGPAVRDLEIGQRVVVMVGWGCGHCSLCVGGHEQLCAQGVEAGSTADGGFAEFILVPHRRHVVPIDIDPIDATPLGCAALCAYAAVKRIMGFLPGSGGRVVVIGAGGLGQYAIQLLRHLTGARVIAVDSRSEALLVATSLGADSVVEADPESESKTAVIEATAGGADAVIDFVGSGKTIDLAFASARTRGIVALLGLAGGTAPYGFFATQPEVVVTTVVAGTVLDLQEVVTLANEGSITSRVTRYSLSDVNTAIDDVREGRITHRPIIDFRSSE